MKANIQALMGNTSIVPASNPYLLYYMSGSVPTTTAAVKAAVDLTDTSDLLSKCVGVCMATSNVTQNSDDRSSYYQIFTLKGTYYSWLKGGYTKIGGYYGLMPSRAYYTNLRKSTLWSMPPNLFAMPANCIGSSAVVGINTSVNYVDSMPSALAYKAASNNIDYTVEYDRSTTVSALRVYNGDAVATNQYPYNAAVFYWDGSTWQSAYSGTTVTAASTYTDLTFTAVSATKFRIVLYPYASVASCTCVNISGLCLMHTVAPTSVSVPDITWGIMTPFPNTSGSSAINPFAVGNYAQTFDPNNNVPTYNISPMYQAAGTCIPAIIDTCGQDSTANMMVITQSTSLTSDLRPLLASYKYNLGELV